MKKFDVEKYLKKNTPPVLTVKSAFRVAAVIPAYNENKYIFSTFDSIRQAAEKTGLKLLTVVVINHPPGADPRESEELCALHREGKFPGECEVIYLPGLSGGVGAARKAGMDAFIRTIPPEEMENAVICSLDADTVVEEDYFQSILPEVLGGGAVSIPFSHQKAETPAQQDAIDTYEAYMTRYVQRLAEAGSPYAFYTIGSAFAVRCDACIRAGGMKVRQAGEDFYFLQAVAKTSGIRQLSGKALVHPSPRVSKRVPFGTGPAVASLLAGEKLNEIPDEAFEELKNLLEHSKLDQWLKYGAVKLSDLTGCAGTFLEKEGFCAAWEKVCRNLPDSAKKRQKAFNEWFDGLKTLKFLHFFSDFNRNCIDKKQNKG